jgi:hypothetical protein
MLVPKLSLFVYVDLLTLTLNVKFEVIVRNVENQRRNFVLSVHFVGWKCAFIPFQFHGLVPFVLKLSLALGLEMLHGTKFFPNYSLPPPLHATKRYGGSGGRPPFILNLGTRWS